MGDLWLTEDIEKTLSTLQEGGVILYPTDTIWGLGANAFEEQAVERIYAIKQRPRNKPMVLIVDSIAMLKEHIEHIHPRVETLLALHRQPLTIVYPKARNLPEYLLGDGTSIAVRVVQSAFCQELIRQVGAPLISTSANISEAEFPRSYGDIAPEILEGVDYVCMYGRNHKAAANPSVIATFNHKGQLSFLR